MAQPALSNKDYKSCEMLSGCGSKKKIAGCRFIESMTYFCAAGVRLGHPAKVFYPQFSDQLLL